MLEVFGESAMAALIGGAGGVVLGLAARLGRFCTLGAIEDLLYQGSDQRLRMWILAIGVAMIGAHLLIGTGLMDPWAPAYLRLSWAPHASILGGLVFGYGMALAGNCPYGALARLGGGDLRAFVVVIVVGVSSYAALSGPLARLRVWAFPRAPVEADLPGGLSFLLGDLAGLPPAVIGCGIGTALVAAALGLRGRLRRRSAVLWGALVGLAVASGWAGSAWLSHVTFEAVPVVSHSFAEPLGETVLWLMTASGTPLSFGIGSVLGVLAGAFLGSLVKGHFRWEACEDPRELRRQIAGAAMMGVGAAVAMGCTVGQGISAFAVLAYGAPVTFAAILLGAALGLRQLIEGFALRA